MNINIKYFAALRESAGKSSEVISIDAKSVEEVYNHLNELYSFSVDRHHLKVAINEEYADFSDSISEGDTLVFIPPVAGG